MRNDPHESRKFPGVAQLLGDLVQPGFLQRDRDDSLFFFAFKERSLGCFKVSAKQKQDRSLFFDGVFGSAMKGTVRAGRERVKIDRRMSDVVRAGRFVEILFEIASARIEDA